ncbi:hypothetical protein SAMD00019534_055350, partial [Acytostelium subglobosum LB1]|uniref:hypothetical protein n=1 Tax=Acytostelium subglobosum LB1 TaxID=1410327 RepID=UPI000644C409
MNDSDPPTRQFVMWLEKQENFVVIPLDDTHLFLQGANNNVIEVIQRRLDELQDQNTYNAFDQAN